jgi:hypothetical protein
MQVEEPNKDIYSLLARMKKKLRSMREESLSEKKRCFGLLHDALVFSEAKLHLLPASSLVEFIELTAWTVRENGSKEHYRKVEKQLRHLGFSVVPAN